MNEFLSRKMKDSLINEPDPMIEAKLRRTMRDQADRFEPRPEAYVKLQQRLNTQRADYRTGRGSKQRTMALAAGLLLVVGMVGYFGLRGDGQQVVTDMAATPGQTPEATQVSEKEAPIAESAVDDVPLAVGDFPVAPNLTAGPLAPTPTDAALSFLELVRISNFAEIRPEGTTVAVFAQDSAGEVGNLVTTLDLAVRMNAAGEPQYLVTGATSDAVTIGDLGDSWITEPTIELSTIGTGSFSGQANLRLYSSNDGVLLDAQAVQVGDTTTISNIPVMGHDFGWVVVQAGNVGSSSIGEFSATPVFFKAPLSSVEYAVAHIPVDDFEQGLVMRSSPSIDAEVLGVLAPGEGGIYRRGKVPSSLTGPYDWWAIETENGTRGWVNARYLVRTSMVSELELRQVAEAFLLAVRDPNVKIDGSLWPDPRRKPVQVGWIRGLRNVSGQDLASSAWWNDETQEWKMDPAYTDTVRTSLRTFLGIPDEVELDLDGQFQSPYPLDQAAIDSNFARLARVSIRPAGSEFDSVDRVVTLYVEQTPDGPVIVGISVWIWSP